MNAVIAPATAVHDALWRQPWCGLDDAGLLAALAGPRPVHYDAAVDPEEVPPARIEGILAGQFEFNGETHALPDPVPWLANPSADVEWHILLHKFYWAVGLAQQWQHSGDARYAQRFATLADSWMQAVPPGFIAADVTGRRVQHWLYALRLFVFHGRGAGAVPLPAALLRRLLHSLHQQVEYLCGHLTPKRNHRTLELLAIYLAGVALPEFERAAHWRAFALQQTLDNLHADLLPDGVHCELSTDYHCLALRNWLAVRTLAARHGQPVPPEMDAALQRALHFAQHVHQPGGRLPSFSDGDAKSYGPLLALGRQLYGTAPLQRRAHYPQAGYHVLRSGPGPRAQHLVLDCGPLGEGNHGHFDALAIELAAHGRPLLVDPGRCTYSEAGPVNWRLHFRGTAAHNTVCVDGLNQTAYTPRAVKGATRHAPGSLRHKVSGPAPQTQLLAQAHGPALDLLHGRCASACYDAVHQRCIAFVDRRYWIVRDLLHAPSLHTYALSYQLDSAAQGACEQPAPGLLHSPGLWLAQPAVAGQQAALEPGWVSPRYGQRLAAPVWRTREQARDACFDTVLWPTETAGAQLAVAAQAVQGSGGEVARALRIHLQEGGEMLHDGWFHAGQATAGGPQAWQIGAYRLQGQWLHWREDAAGRLLRALSHAGARLHGPQGELALTVVLEGAAE